MKNYFIILGIIFTLCFIGPVSTSKTSESDFSRLSPDGALLFTKNLRFTRYNISLATTKIFVGSVLGAGANYYVNTSITENANLSMNLVFTRGAESSFISLTPESPAWNGNLTFMECCSTVAKNLYAFLQFSNLFNVRNQSNIIFSIYYSIYSSPITETRIINGRTIEVNALGYPYPDQNYIRGLMILLVGFIPVAIIVNILKRFMRRKKFKKENIKE